MSSIPGAYRLWWTLKGSDQAVRIMEVCNKILRDDSDRQDRNLRSLRLYGNAATLGFSGYGTVASVGSASNLPDNRVKINIISNMCDTVSSKIGKMKPKVSFLTSDGTTKEQKNARKLTTFVSGLFYANKVHRLHQDAFRNATILDLGAVKHYIRDDKIVSERVLANELLVDPIDAMYGDPRSLYQIKFIHREVLKAAFPSKAGIINAAKSEMERIVQMSSEEAANYVAVVEAWHLPSKADGSDGRHVICVDNDILFAEVYKKTYFPFTFFRWSSRIVGWFGQSLAERLTGTQVEINKMLRTIQTSFHLGSAFKVFLEQGSRVAKEQINNEIGSIIYYSGTKPDFYVPQTVHPEYFQHLNFLIQSAYEEAGISQLSASSRKPAGIDSGKALREYNEIETERFALVSQEYEATYLETARQYIDLAEDLAADGVDVQAVAESKRFLETIKWSEIDIERDQFIMQMFPVSSLPSTPAGKLQYVQELINSGYIDQAFALKLLDFPDTDAYARYANAGLDDILSTIEDILEGVYRTPEPFQDLALGVKLMGSAYLNERNKKGASQSVLEDMRTWIETATLELDKAAASQAPQGGPPPDQQQSLPPPA